MKEYKTTRILTDEVKVANVEGEEYYRSVVSGLRLESQIRRRRAVASGMGNSFFEDGFANKRLSSWRMVICDIMDFVRWLCYF